MTLINYMYRYKLDSNRRINMLLPTTFVKKPGSLDRMSDPKCCPIESLKE